MKNYQDWNNLEKVISPDLIKMIGSMVDNKCYRQTEFHPSLTKDDFKYFALLKVLKSEIYKTEIDYNNSKSRSYIFKMIRNNIQDNYDYYLPIKKPFGKQKQLNRLFFNLEKLNIGDNIFNIDGADAFINQLGMKDYNRLVHLSYTKRLKTPEGRRLRRKINITKLRDEI